MRRTALVCFLLVTASAARAAGDPPHHAERGFTNPYAEPRSSSFFSVVRSMLFSDEWQRYDPDRDVVETARPMPATETDDDPVVTWIGHSTILLQHQGINVLTDPMFSRRASPVQWAGPARITQPAMDLDELPPIHAVVISHDHFDHLDVRSIKALGSDPMYFVPLELERWFVKRGIASDRIVELDWWETETLTVGERSVEITATPSQHFSGRSLTGRNATLWAAWSLRWDGFHAWFGGDTGYNDRQFKAVPERLGPVDLGMIPIGAYEPRRMMGTVHVNPAEAVMIHDDIGARASLGMHWGTFVLAAEGVLTPVADLAAAVPDRTDPDSQFVTFAVGESRRYVDGALHARRVSEDRGELP